MTERQSRPEATAADAVLVNVGCGDQPLPGFVNLDLGRDADLKLDVRGGLPFADGTVDGIHSEHFVEHLTQGELMAFLRECRRALRPGGVVRIATPDLAEIVRCYLDPDWHERSGLKDYGYDWLANPCEMLNVCLRDWGHQHVVDAAELKRLARLAGLAEPVVCATGESRWPFFRGVETRLGRHLVMEFRRPAPAPRPAGGPPLVSVLIAAYEPRWFEAALLSARRQTHAHLEILVGDDSPGDEIEAVCRRHAAEDPRVSYVRNPAVLGEIDNWQALYERARGDYVKCLADDDLLEPDCVARLVAALAGSGGATLAASYRRLIDEEGCVLPDDFNAPLAATDVLIRGTDLAALMLGGRRNFIGEPTTCLFRREDAADAQPTLMSFGGRRALTNGDMSLWCHLLSKGDLVLLREPLSSFRQRTTQTCRSERHRADAQRAWELLGQDARRLGLWSGAALAGGRIAARPLAPPPPPTPEISVLLPAAGGLPAILRGLAALRAEQLPTAIEYVVADAGLSAPARRYLERAIATQADLRLAGAVVAGCVAAIDRSAAVNLAAATARGACLVVADLDAPLPAGWLAAAVMPLVSQPDLAASGSAAELTLAVRADCFRQAGGCGAGDDWRQGLLDGLNRAGFRVLLDAAPAANIPCA
ncbi:MAG: glycosyltransferase [bacterium]|nr:glycosyltransferase [bacterium]